MTLKEFVVKYIFLESTIRVYVRYPDEPINLWCDYIGTAKDLILNGEEYDRLLSNVTVEYIVPSLRRNSAIIDIHAARN